MKKNLIIIIALLAGPLAYSQPGYQGHKFLVLYDFNVSPALLNHNAQGETGLASFNLTHQVKAEYAGRRKLSLGLQASFNKASLNVVGFNNDARPIKSNYYGFGIYAKRFASDDANLAPRGSYFQFGLGAEYVSIYDERSSTQLHSYLGDFSIQCGFGKQSILYKRVMIDYGVTFSLNTAFLNIVPAALTYDNTFNGTGELNYTEGYDKSKLQKMATWTSLTSNIVQVKIGLGLLP
jgi:hypothetical protein